jgi:preprotein translocase subunit SecE
MGCFNMSFLKKTKDALKTFTTDIRQEVAEVLTPISESYVTSFISTLETIAFTALLRLATAMMRNGSLMDVDISGRFLLLLSRPRRVFGS